MRLLTLLCPIIFRISYLLLTCHIKQFIIPQAYSLSCDWATIEFFLTIEKVANQCILGQWAMPLNYFQRHGIFSNFSKQVKYYFKRISRKLMIARYNKPCKIKEALYWHTWIFLAWLCYTKFQAFPFISIQKLCGLMSKTIRDPKNLHLFFEVGVLSAAQDCFSFVWCSSGSVWSNTASSSSVPVSALLTTFVHHVMAVHMAGDQYMYMPLVLLHQTLEELL